MKFIKHPKIILYICFIFASGAFLQAEETPEMFYLELRANQGRVDVLNAEILPGRARNYGERHRSNGEPFGLRYEIQSEGGQVVLDQLIADPSYVFVEKENGEGGCEVLRQEEVKFVLRIPYRDHFRKMNFFKVSPNQSFQKTSDPSNLVGSFELPKRKP